MFRNGGPGGTRTRMPLLASGPKPGASTNFATGPLNTIWYRWKCTKLIACVFKELTRCRHDRRTKEKAPGEAPLGWWRNRLLRFILPHATPYHCLKALVIEAMMEGLASTCLVFYARRYGMSRVLDKKVENFLWCLNCWFKTTPDSSWRSTRAQTFELVGRLAHRSSQQCSRIRHAHVAHP